MRSVAQRFAGQLIVVDDFAVRVKTAARAVDMGDHQGRRVRELALEKLIRHVVDCLHVLRTRGVEFIRMEAVNDRNDFDLPAVRGSERLCPLHECRRTRQVTCERRGARRTRRHALLPHGGADAAVKVVGHR